MTNYNTPEYRAWEAMRQRCLNPNNPKYPRYGGRGIKVCPRWRSFIGFLADMGKRPSAQHSLDRKDNDGNYEPDNCRWATRLEQDLNTSRSRLVTYEGRTQHLFDWADELSLNRTVVISRFKSGKPPALILYQGKLPAGRAAIPYK